jgi:hypothetical protein
MLEDIVCQRLRFVAGQHRENVRQIVELIPGGGTAATDQGFPGPTIGTIIPTRCTVPFPSSVLQYPLDPRGALDDAPAFIQMRDDLVNSAKTP